MKDGLGDLLPSRAYAKRMLELEGELRRARAFQRRHSKSPETLGRWGLDQPTDPQEGESWFLTYLDMMTLLLVVMIVMFAFSGGLSRYGQPDPAAHVAQATPASGAEAGAHGKASGDGAAAPMVITDVKADVDAGGAVDVGVAADVSAAADAQAPSSSESAATEVPPLAEEGTERDHAAVALDSVDLSVSSSAGHGHGVLQGGSGLLPGGTGLLPGGNSIHELYPGFSPADLAASFVGPPRPPIAPTLEGSPAEARQAALETDTAASSSETLVALPPAQADDPVSEGEAMAAGLALSELGSDVQVVISERSVNFRVNSEILFDSSQADLSRSGLAVLRRIVKVLSGTNHEITVEGHTDSVPVRRNVRYPSNWELSSARAGSVVRYLQANGIERQRLKAVGYADTRPIGDNHTPDGRAANRRVELVIEKRD